MGVQMTGSRLFPAHPLGNQSPTAELGQQHELASHESLLLRNRPLLRQVPHPFLGSRESPLAPSSDTEIEIVEPRIAAPRRKRKLIRTVCSSDDEFEPNMENGAFELPDQSPPPKKQKRLNNKKTYRFVEK